MMIAILLYGYCTGERSSRRIERRCGEDVLLTSSDERVALKAVSARTIGLPLP
jgi:hypothetical protein